MGLFNFFIVLQGFRFHYAHLFPNFELFLKLGLLKFSQNTSSRNKNIPFFDHGDFFFSLVQKTALPDMSGRKLLVILLGFGRIWNPKSIH